MEQQKTQNNQHNVKLCEMQCRGNETTSQGLENMFSKDTSGKGLLSKTTKKPLLSQK